jgi:hypothetical protein
MQPKCHPRFCRYPYDSIACGHLKTALKSELGLIPPARPARDGCISNTYKERWGRDKFDPGAILTRATTRS